MTSDVTVLEKAWIKAGDLAARHLPEAKAESVAKELGNFESYFNVKI